jgi:riboflavin transporter FmnP
MNSKLVAVAILAALAALCYLVLWLHAPKFSGSRLDRQDLPIVVGFMLLVGAVWGVIVAAYQALV